MTEPKLVSVTDGEFTLEVASKKIYEDEAGKGLGIATPFNIYQKGVRIGEFMLAPFPGCCGVVVLFHLNISSYVRGKGINTHLWPLKRELIKKLGYTSMLATTIKNSKAPGYDVVQTFKNSRTGNTVHVLATSV